MRCRLTNGRAVVLAASFICLATASRASLITIHPTFAASITRDPNAAAIESTINSAINYYDTTFTTGFSPLTVNITFQETTTGLGGSSTSVATVSYSSFITQLHAASSGDATDTTALAGLPITAVNPVDGSGNILLTTANCRALGIVLANGACVAATDSTISLNTSITSPPGASGPNTYGLLGVTEHEIDEALGLGSSANSSIIAVTAPRPEDLFRYSSTGARVYNTSAGFDDAWFSLDGKVLLVQFNNNANPNVPPGDYGDWWSHNGGGNPPGGVPPARVQDAYAFPGTNPTLANEFNSPEVIALDAIGYNLAPLPTPEPTTMLLTGSGLLAAALLAKRRGARSSKETVERSRG
jgi:hypothetical protein